MVFDFSEKLNVEHGQFASLIFDTTENGTVRFEVMLKINNFTNFTNC
jgi:hypothetical protein